MIVKNAIIFVCIAFFLLCIDGSTIKRKSVKKVKCYVPVRPEDMPEDVYQKYKISSKNLTNEGRKDFWQKFQDWWKDSLTKVKAFFEKVGKFFKNLFSNNKNKNQTTTVTEAPPTPSPQKRRDGVICIEIDENDNNGNNGNNGKTQNDTKTSADMPTTTTTTTTTTTKITTAKSIITTTKMVELNEETTFSDSFTKHYEDQVETKEPEPKIIGIEHKYRKIAENNKKFIENQNNDPTIIKGV